MASKKKNLSSYDADELPNASGYRIGIVVSQWNAEITSALLNGASQTLKALGVQPDHIFELQVPGAFELPLGAQVILEKEKVDAVICLGSVIKGETDHFEFICNACAQGIKDVSLKYSRPVIFGVLTDNNWEQAKARSGGDHGNKGVEAAVTAVKMVGLLD